MSQEGAFLNSTINSKVIDSTAYILGKALVLGESKQYIYFFIFFIYVSPKPRCLSADFPHQSESTDGRKEIHIF